MLLFFPARERDWSRGKEMGIAVNALPDTEGGDAVWLEGKRRDTKRRAEMDARLARLAGPMNLPFLEEHTWHEPFVEPRERHLVDVPIQFATGKHFCKVPLPNPQRESSLMTTYWSKSTSSSK